MNFLQQYLFTRLLINLQKFRFIVKFTDLLKNLSLNYSHYLENLSQIYANALTPLLY